MATSPKSPKEKLADLAKAKRSAARSAKRKATKIKLVVPADGSNEGLNLALMSLRNRIDKLEEENSRLRCAATGRHQSVPAPMATRGVLRPVGHNKYTYTAYNHGQQWSFEYDKIVTNSVSSTDGDLVTIGCAIGRTPFSVFARLVKIGRVTEKNCYNLWASVAKRGYVNVDH